jgi:hypothetical protein
MWFASIIPATLEVKIGRIMGPGQRGKGKDLTSRILMQCGKKEKVLRFRFERKKIKWPLSTDDMIFCSIQRNQQKGSKN